jgi:hypothetical protein
MTLLLLLLCVIIECCRRKNDNHTKHKRVRACGASFVVNCRHVRCAVEVVIAVGVQTELLKRRNTECKFAKQYTYIT